MKVKIYNQEREVLVQTVRVRRDPDEPNKLVVFHCPYCCDPVLQIQGLVDKIIPGVEPTDDVVTVSKAFGCHFRYTFQNTNALSDWATITLNSFEKDHPSNVSDSSNIFHCYICRQPLARFNSYIIYMLHPLKQVELPVSLVCPTHDCLTKYLVNDVI